MSTGKLPPYNQVEWEASTIADGVFGGYRVYVRPAILPAPPFLRVGDLAATVANAARVKANHLRFRDFASGWGGDDSPWAVGHDYLVTAWNRSTNLESKIYGSPVVRKALVPDTRHWIVVPEAPYLNAALNVTNIAQDWIADPVVETPGFAGRPLGFTRTQIDRAGRKWSLDWYYHALGGLPEERVRWPYAIMEAGRTGTLLVPDGDRFVGSLRAVKASRSGDEGTRIQAEGEFLETANWTPAGYNLPPGLKLNGTSQYLSTPSVSALNPGSSPFSVVWCGTLTNAAGTWMAKQNGTTGQGYLLDRSASNTIRWKVVGATTNGEVTYLAASLFDGNEHVIVGVYDGTELRLYVDGVIVKAAKLVAGAVSNSIAVTVGAVNGGASSFKAGTVHAAAYYGRALTPAEVVQTGYLLTWSGQRMPGGPETFVDLRDQRSWKGQAGQYEDLSGNLRRWTSTASPTIIGTDTWRLQELDILAQVT